jgi:AraC-like DNA-binding protein
MKPPPFHRRNIDDPNDEWWTVDEAAAHFGLRRETVLRYIREGLTLYRGGFLRRDQFLAEYRKRAQRRNATRAGKVPRNSG